MEKFHGVFLVMLQGAKLMLSPNIDPMQILMEMEFQML